MDEREVSPESKVRLAKRHFFKWLRIAAVCAIAAVIAREVRLWLNFGWGSANLDRDFLVNFCLVILEMYLLPFASAVSCILALKGLIDWRLMLKRR